MSMENTQHDSSQPATPTGGPTRRLRGNFRTLWISSAALTTPFMIISAVLLGLVFHFEVHQNKPSSGNLSLAYARSVLDQSKYIYTNISPTRLARIASLYSTVLAYIGTFAVVLASYPLGVFVLQHSLQDQTKLLTPFQLALVLRFIEGSSFSAILSWLGYMRRPLAHHQRRPQPYPAIGVVMTAILTAIFGILLFAAEWWLHFAIQPFNFSQITSLNPSEGTYSYTLPINCLDTNNSYNAQLQTKCSLSPSIKGGNLINAVTALEVLNNISTTASVNSVSSNDQRVFLGRPGNGAQLHQDFSATSYSVLTQCKLITSECGLSRDSIISDATSPFTCSKYPALTGNLADQFAMTYFTDSTGTSNDTAGGDYVSSNPFFFAANGFTPPAAEKVPLQEDTEFVALEFGGLAYVLYCNATVYDLRYTAINGSIQNFETSPSNASIATLFLQPMQNSGAGGIKLEDSANLAGLSTTEQQFASAFSLTYSQVLLSLAAGTFIASPVTDLQQTAEILVARVQKSALYTLVALSLLFVLLGLLLTLVAWLAAITPNVDEVRQRLSLLNLVAEKFEGHAAHQPIDDLDQCFTEFSAQEEAAPKRVGIVGRPGEGWELQSLKPQA